VAEVQIPEEALKPLEGEEGLESASVATGLPEGVSEQDVEEEAAASNLDEAEGLEEALPDEPDEDEEEVPEEDEEIGLEQTFTDQSNLLYIGRQFTLQGFANWFAAQKLGSLPYNGIGIHHTAIPTGSQYVGPKTVKAIFDFYEREHGWTRGKGPHLWLYGGDNPKYHPGKVLVAVGTHPAHDGIGITGRNHRWLHIEAFGNFDGKKMPDGVVRGYKFLLQVLSQRRDQPVRINQGPGDRIPTTWQGALFHRDAKTNRKSCPGTTTTHDWFDRAMMH
jgi:N-acetylmuramoyl-L-alanine amidase